MNVAFFSNQFASSQGHGIAHYAHRLYEHLCILPNINVLPVATWSDLPASQLRDLRESTKLRLLPWGRKLTPLCWTFLNWPPIEQWLDVPTDITHMVAPGFPVATNAKLVVTVHDLGPILHPEYFSDSKPWLFRRGMDFAVANADALVCVSESTAIDLLDVYGSHLEGKVHVALEGVDKNFFGTRSIDQLKPLPTGGKPFFLAAGAMSPRKNLKRVLAAFERVQDVIPHHLILVGGSGWESKEIHEELSKPSMRNRVHHLGYVSDSELRALYQAAEFYVHPSLYEGFGLTILEAMAAGCPVITSNTSSLPEVAGEAAELVDPISIDEIAESILKMASSEQLRERMRTNGLERASQFSWSDCAAKVANVYRAL